MPHTTRQEGKRRQRRTAWHGIFRGQLSPWCKTDTSGVAGQSVQQKGA